jgi:hypothetical protein
MVLKKDSDVQEIKREVPFYKSDLEDVDMALYKFFDERLDIQASTNKGFRKVPVIWAGAERAQNIKREDIPRDKKGNVKYPIIVVERGNISKDLTKKVFPYAAVDPAGDLRGGFMEINKVIKQDKTSNFKKADAFRTADDENRPIYRGKEDTKIVYETLTIPVPIYVEIEYKITLRSEYQQQMNDMLTPILRSAGVDKRVMLTYNRNMYEAFFEASYSAANNISSYELNEKKYESSISMKVLGYLIGDGKNQKQPMVARRENPVQIRFLRERVMVGDIDDVF